MRPISRIPSTPSGDAGSPAPIGGLEAQVNAGEKAARYVAELRRYNRPGGYLEPLRQVPVFEITFAHLEDLDSELRSRGLSPKTRSHVLAALCTFLRWLRQRQTSTPCRRSRSCARPNTSPASSSRPSSGACWMASPSRDAGSC
jgi:hypothetical protein